MSYFDVIIVCILFGFTLFGLWFGLIQSVGSIVGTIAGAYIAGHYFQPIAAWVITRSDWSENTARIVVFFILFVAVTRVIGALFWFAQKFLRLIPFGRLANRISGAALGFIEGLIVLGLFVYLVQKFPLAGSLAPAINASQVIDWTEPLVNRIVAQFPWLFSKLLQLL
ncbi:hypothetical protein A3H75_02175 [Candidatus Uhrbacteria bacterium RIFCSPLOWO2_02_FULL_51_9]|uniref:Colicin V production protein n=1 Tax=Candidatus Uhrbacteria bacterium RIFCSPLOWO2_02_FULL_51_9 TaxID=1802410 RepID=A0A1F7VH49_9BACT|nr:MAG: hypothetical protein A3H75_02175 [Candidatus Uhrbacteria bacterium RIFCSPLOWO2_02_FULL_51_9]